MKTLRNLLFITITATLAIPASAAPKEKKAEGGAVTGAAIGALAGEKAAAAAEKAAKTDKPLPMNARVDEIDAKAKTFTQTTQDGKKVKHVVTATTTIMQGEAAAKFEDIKVGDMVAGLRKKTNEDGTEYEVVKITKFGPKKAKEPKADGEKKPEKKKKAE